MKKSDPLLRQKLVDYLNNRQAALFHVNREGEYFHNYKRLDGKMGYVSDSYSTTDTVCVLRVPGGFVVGTTVQSPKDVYNRIDGNEIAFLDALESSMAFKPVPITRLGKTILKHLEAGSPKFHCEHYTLKGRKGQDIDESLAWFQQICSNLESK